MANNPIEKPARNLLKDRIMGNWSHPVQAMKLYESDPAFREAIDNKTGTFLVAEKTIAAVLANRADPEFMQNASAWSRYAAANQEELAQKLAVMLAGGWDWDPNTFPQSPQEKLLIEQLAEPARKFEDDFRKRQLQEKANPQPQTKERRHDEVSELKQTQYGATIREGVPTDTIIEAPADEKEQIAALQKKLRAEKPPAARTMQVSAAELARAQELSKFQNPQPPSPKKEGFFQRMANKFRL